MVVLYPIGMEQLKNKKVLAVMVGLVVWVGLFYLQKQLFVTADLGRHIVNGKVILESGKIPTTNLYSYTMPDYPTSFHHWMSGVVFYEVYKIMGFEGLSYLDAGLKVLTLVLALMVALRKASWRSVLLTVVVAVPLITSRREIRPEVFSYLLIVVYVWVMEKWKSNPEKYQRWLWLLPVLAVGWINLHVYFVLGWAVIGVYIVATLVAHSPIPVIKRLGWVLGLVVIMGVINPSGVAGLWEPISLSGELNYGVVEGENVWQVYTATGYYQYLAFMGMGLVVLWLIYDEPRRKIEEKKVKTRGNNLMNLWLGGYRIEAGTMLLGLFLILGIYQIRFEHIFGLMVVMFGPEKLDGWIDSLWRKRRNDVNKGMVLASVGLVFSGVVVNSSYYNSWQNGFGMGLMEPVVKIGEFFDEQQIKGPVFNN